jgi:hypothetical protein
VVKDSVVKELQDKFKDGLEEKCQIGASNVRFVRRSHAWSNVIIFYRPQKLLSRRLIHSLLECIGILTVPVSGTSVENVLGTDTDECVALRRHGTSHRDLNVELLAPFSRNIAVSWSKVFETDLFASFRKAAVAVINNLVQEVEASAPLGLKDRTKTQTEVCLEEATLTMEKTVEVVRNALTSEQKEISRCLAPHVQGQLKEGYNRAMEEKGKGSVARQKVSNNIYILCYTTSFMVCVFCSCGFMIFSVTARMTCSKAVPILC